MISGFKGDKEEQTSASLCDVLNAMTDISAKNIGA